MNATGATLVFLVPLATLGLATASVGGIGVALLSSALTLPVGAFTFWLGARRVRQKWYSAFISGVLVVVVVLQTIALVKLIFPLWLQLAVIEVAIATVSFWLGSRPPLPEIANAERKQESDYLLYVAIVFICVLPFALVPALGIIFLQRVFLSADSLLFGSTVDGKLMLLVPTIVPGLLAAFLAAWPLTKWFQRVLRLPGKAPIFLADQVKAVDWKPWRLAGGVAGVILFLVAAKGFGSYFRVTESGISVRPPLELSMRRYEWEDVTTVWVRCIHSQISKRENRFRYVLRMSDGYEVDLATALDATTLKVRSAYAERFAEVIPSHLDAVPNILYQFDVSRDGLVSLGEKRGMALPNAIGGQVLAHGGTLQ